MSALAASTIAASGRSRVQNLFNANYFDYAIASPFPFGFGSQLNTYNAYPQPGRTFMLKGWVQTAVARARVAEGWLIARR